jgi:molecular chaperone DnaK (HSP70)
VTLIKEPEAAALYTMHSLDFTLSPGDAFVLCDAGGGTVDLISYEVEAVSPRLQLKEVVPGTGTNTYTFTVNCLYSSRC